MTSSIIKLIWIPALAACVAVGGASYLQGQNQSEFEWDFVPPSPAPHFPIPAATVAPPGSSASNSNVSASPHKSQTVGRATSLPSVPRQSWSAAQPQASSSLTTGYNGAKKSSTPSAGTMASRRNSSATSSPVYSKVTPVGQVTTNGGAVTASHEVLEAGLPPVDVAVPSFGGRSSAVFMQQPSFPMDRNSPPSVIGSHLGLKPGETATERSLRLMSAIGDLERHVEDVTQQNANLNLLVNQRDEKLQLAVREIRSARKDLMTAKDELERLKREVDDLREKVRNAEKDNAAVLQTMAPLLQQLLESDDVNSFPTKPVE